MNNIGFATLILFSLNSHALIGGKKLEGLTDVVRLNFKDGTMCSGTFIDPNTILTAAHCLRNDIKIEKILASNDSVIAVIQLKNILHPDPETDLAIMKTTKNEKFHAQFKISNGNNSFFSSATLYGCGISNFNPKERVCSSGKNSFLRIGERLYFFGNPSVAPNDSGGAVTDASEVEEIIAVSIQTATYLSIATVLDAAFVRNNLGESR